MIKDSFKHFTNEFFVSILGKQKIFLVLELRSIFECGFELAITLTDISVDVELHCVRNNKTNK